MAKNWADEIWEKEQKKRRAVQGESVTDRGGDWALDNYNRIKSGDISLLSENRKSSSIDRNYVNRLTTYAANPRKNEGSAQEYYDYLHTNESEMRDYLGVGSYELASRRLLDEIARQKKADRLKGSVGNGIVEAVETAATRAKARSAAGGMDNTSRDADDGLYALTQRKTALTRERARLDDMVGQYDQSDTELWDDWHERSNAINEALAKLGSQISTAESNARLGQYDKLRSNSDFAEYAAKGEALENPTYEKAQSGIYLFGNRIGDDDVRNRATYARDNSERLAQADTAIVNGTDKQTALLRHMTGSEVQMYSYLLAKDNENGTAEAQKYLDALNETLRTRQSGAVNEFYTQMSDEHPAVMSAASVLGGPIKGAAYAGAVLDKARTGNIDRNSGAMQFARGMDTIRSTVSGNIQQGVQQNTGNPFLGDAASFLYQTGMSIADSAYNAAITGGTPGLSAMLMSGSAATSAMNDALEQGANERQALAIGGAAGIFESLFEYVSLDKLVKMSSPAARGSAVMNVLKQMGIEASEEAATEIANIAVDYALMGDASQYRKMSPAQIAWQVTKAAFGGGLSGGVMGGGAQLVSSMRAHAIGSDIKQQGLAESVMQDAANSGDEQLMSLAQRMEQGKAKQSSRNLGRLYAGMAENGTGMPSTEAALREAAYQMAAQQEEQTADMPAEQQDTVQPPETRRTAQAAATQAQQQEKPVQNAANAAESGAEQQTGNPSGRSAESPSAARSARRDSAVSLPDDERVDVAGIDTVEDGTVYVRTEDGGVLALGDVEFSNPDVAAVYQDAAQYDTDAAQKYVSAYDGTATPEQYKQGFAAVYRAARSGLSYEQALGSLPAQAYLTQDQRITAYAAGQKVQQKRSKQDAGDGQPYVKADRRAIYGNDPDKWAGQITNYINRQIRKGQDVTVYAVDGDPLTITRDTAGKARFRNRVRLADGTYRLMTDAEYAVKLRAQAHIDELAEVSKRGDKTVPDRKKHSFARDGFNYRTAYFMDDTGYYRLTISVGKNGSINTIYNVGKIEEAEFPMSGRTAEGAQRPNETKSQENSASADSIAQNDTAVKDSVRKSSAEDAQQPGLTRSYRRADLSQEAQRALRKHREQLHAVDVMAKKYGRKVVLVDTLEGKTISGTKITEAVNGAYDGKTGTIYITVDAQDGAFAYVAMHELVHSIKAESAEGYAALEQAVFDALKNTGEDVQALVQYQMDKFGYSEEAAREEVVANTAPTVLTDEQFVQDLYNSERSLFERIRAFIADLLETFRELTQSGSWKQDATLAKDVEAVRKIADVLDRAARGDLAQKDMVTNGDGEAGAYSDGKLSAKDSPMGNLSEESTYTYDNLTRQPPMKVVQIKSAPYTYLNEVGKNVVDKKTAKVEGVNNARDNAEGFTNSGALVRNKYTNTLLNVTGSTVTHGIDGNFTRRLTNAKLGFVAGELAKNAIPLNEIAVTNPDAEYTYVMVGYARQGNREFLALCHVNHYTNHQDWVELYDVMHSINGRTKNASVPKSGAQSQANSSGSGTDAVISIADLIDVVKELQPDLLSRDVIENHYGEIWQPEGYYKGITKFSVKDVTPEDTQRLEKENARLKAALENARAQVRLTGGNQVSAQAVEKLARKIVRDTHSRYDAAALAGDLGQIYTYAATAENSEEALREIDDVGIGLAKKVLRQSEQMDTTVSDQLTGLKDYLRNTGLSLNEDQKAEAAAMYGSYNDFRRQVFGTIKLTRDGVPLDAAWGELHDAYPWLFDADGTDMLESLVHAAELTRPQLVNPYGYNLDEAAADLWLTMQQEYANLPVNRTYADRQKARLDALRAEQAENLRRMRQEAKDRYEERLKAVKADNRAKRAELSKQYKKAVEDVKTAERMAEGRLRAKERQKAQKQLQAAKQRAKELARQHQLLANEKLAQQQAEFREWKRADRADRKERTAAEKYRTRIVANAKTLAGWLEKPTDDKHVPESLRRAVSGVLETIELGNGARKTKKAEAWRERLMDLAVEMDRIDNAPDEGTYLDVDPDLTQRIRDFVSGTRNLQYIDLMSAEQLRDLDYILQVTKRTVTYANRLRANAQYQQISALGEASIKEMDGKKAKPRMNAAVGKLDQFFNIQQLDSFAFFDELGGAATSVLQELRDGFDVKVRRVQRAVEYVQPFLEDVDVRKLSGKGAKIREFTVEDGTLRMTTAQIMELYELLKREQARGHIFGSGIRVADISRGKLRPEVVQLDPVRITVEEAERITGTLTDEQKQLADRLAWFLGNECAAWGNQTSQQMYGYKKFTEKNYYPIKTDSNYTQTSDKNDKGQNGSLSALKNLGMTKAVVKGANNPLIVGDIFDTFTQHVDDMASYNGMMIPLSDAMKWFNYRARTDDMKVRSVKRSMERRAGSHAQGYFTTLIKNLNGINDRGERIGIMDTLTNHAKAAAIGANLRVVLQQPTAYVRAAAVINPKYLLKALTHKPDVRGAKQNSAIALWKSWGFYDISIGKSMRGLLFDDGSVLDNVKEWSMAPAGWADEVTWGTLFNACRLEAQEQHPGASQQEIDAAAGRRLSEIVDRTQVVDSPFHKSQIMRSKDGLTRMYTAFMAEPTKSYNLLRTALSRAIERKDKESMLGFVRTGVVFLMTSAATSAFAAVADMLRDDDKTRTLIEKYLAALKANMADNANPLALIPVVKDILSLLEGYDVSRLDLQAADKLINTGRIWIKQLSAEAGERPYTNWYMAYQTAQALSSATGIPAGNLMRTVSSVANLFGADLRSKTDTAAVSQKYEELYNAILKEDQGYIDRLNTYLQQDKEKSPKDIDSGVAKVLMERDERIAEAYALRQAGDVKGLEALRGEIAEVFGEEIVDRAINLYANTQESDEEKDMTEELSAPLYDYDDMATVARLAFESGETEDLAAVVEEIKLDSSAQDPEEAVRNKTVALFKPEYLERLDAGDTAGAARMKQVLMKVYGLESDTIDAWRTSQRRDELYALIDAGSAREANSMIVQLRSLGRDNDSVRDSVRAHYKPLVVEAWNSGDLTTYKALVNTLKNLNLYDAKGSLYFTDEHILSWLED